MVVEEVKASCGESIESAAQKMLDTYRSSVNSENDVEVRCKFNGATMKCGKGSTLKSIIRHWHRELNAQTKAYRNSPMGKAQDKEDAIEIAYLKAKRQRLMLEFKTLNFNDYTEVLDWLLKIQDISDDTRVGVPVKQILSVLRKHDYKANVNCDADFNEEDRENYARYIIGQAIDGLKKIGAIHGLVHKFTKEWVDKFKVFPSPSYDVRQI